MTDKSKPNKAESPETETGEKEEPSWLSEGITDIRGVADYYDR
jgi:hypothetical protein